MTTRRDRIHSWTAKHFGKTEPGRGEFYENDAIVFAANVDGVSKAIDVLSGESEGYTGDSHSPLGGIVRGTR